MPTKRRIKINTVVRVFYRVVACLILGVLVVRVAVLMFAGSDAAANSEALQNTGCGILFILAVLLRLAPKSMPIKRGTNVVMPMVFSAFALLIFLSGDVLTPELLIIFYLTIMAASLLTANAYYGNDDSRIWWQSQR